MNDRTKDIVISAGILIFGFVTLFHFIPTQVEVTDEYAISSLSPAFFPEVAAWLLVILSAILLLVRITKLHQIEEDAAQSSEVACSPEEEFTGGDEMRVWVAFAISVLYYYGLKYIGFLPATTLALIGLFLLQGVRSPQRLAALSTVTTVSVYLFFHYVMKVYFPEAILFR